MIRKISYFQWKCAMRENYFLFFTIPLVVVFLVYEMFWKQKDKRYQKWVQILEVLYLIALVIWAVIRNCLHI